MAQLEQYEKRVEAMLFASGDPLDSKKIADILEIEEPSVHRLVEHIRDRYQKEDSPFDILRLENSYQMCTLPAYATDIQKALAMRRGASLSQAALEVLAIIAYNQPVTRAFVEEIRGVDCSSIMRGLTEKHLVEEAGRMNIPGKPIMYQTTSTFLRSFGLDSLDHLPILPDSAEISEEEPQLEGQIDLYRQEPIE